MGENKNSEKLIDNSKIDAVLMTILADETLSKETKLSIVFRIQSSGINTINQALEGIEGLEVRSSIQNIFTALATKEAVLQLAELDSVVEIEASEPVEQEDVYDS